LQTYPWVVTTACRARKSQRPVLRSRLTWLGYSSIIVLDDSRPSTPLCRRSSCAPSQAAALVAAVVLGILQGLFEWLPVSSQGVVAATYALIFDKPLDEAVGFALWLHIGTVPSVLVVFWREIWSILKELLALPQTPSAMFRFLFVATLASGVVGFPLILALSDISVVAGTTATGLIGAFMLVTGVVQMRRRATGNRSHDRLALKDGVFVGVAQGLAVVPGLSRSGMTMATLLSLQVERRDALLLSFLLSIPASLAAALFFGIKDGLIVDAEAIVAAFVAFVVGLVTIKVLMVVAVKINFGWFVIAVGSTMIVGALIAWLL